MAAFSTELARVLSKRGFCSRGKARELILAGHVRVNGNLVRNPDIAVKADATIEVDGKSIEASEKIYVMLNKPRGLVTTTADERGRETVYECFKGAALPRIVPVGRLDQASEGLLLFTNDNDWAAQITAPKSKITKTYHVQIDRVADTDLVARMKVDAKFPVCAVQVLRTGEHNSWLEIVLDEGKNRHIRRLLEMFEIEVLRLVRIRIGALDLGNLAKGQWRHLTADEERTIFTESHDA
jgi:23S rRNA pseudouridine2605 synthase